MEKNIKEATEETNNKISDTILFSYENAEEKKSDRTVKVHLIEQNQQGDLYVDRYCFTTGARRTFQLDRISEMIRRMETSEVLPVSEWFQLITGKKPDFKVLERQAVTRPPRKNNLSLVSAFCLRVLKLIIAKSLRSW